MNARLKTLFVLTIGYVCFSWGSLALDSASEEGQRKTQELLKNKAARDKFIESDPKAKKVQENLNNLAPDPATQQEIYELVSDILPKLIEQSGGDVSKLQEIVAKAAENPASFANTFTPEQRERLKQVADKLQAKPPTQK